MTAHGLGGKCFMMAKPTDPRWFVEAKSLFGTKEIPGLKHNSKILDWLAKLGAWWRDDETPWCGVFVAHCIKAAGLGYPKDYYRAKSWASWGSRLGPDRLAPGAILVFGRTGGGHVGFYAGEDKAYYYVLGGNQANAVNIVRIAKGRLIASRWPKGEPVLGGPNHINLKVQETTNEE